MFGTKLTNYALKQKPEEEDGFNARFFFEKRLKICSLVFGQSFIAFFAPPGGIPHQPTGRLLQ